MPGGVPALVFGNGPTALGVVRILRAAGVTAYVVSDDPQLVSQSRWFQPAPPSRSAATPEQDLAAYLEGLPVPRAVLMPCSDSWAVRIAALPESITERFPRCLAPVHVLERLADKGQLAEALREAKVPHPRTLLLDTAADVATIPSDALTHAFLKPRDSQRFFRRFGTKGFWVRSHHEAAQRWQDARSEGHTMLFQEYIPGPPSRHYHLDGFIDSKGRMAAMFARRRLRMYPLDFGNNTLTVSVPLSEVTDARESLARLLDHVGFHGIFSAEFKYDERDSRFKLIEVNVRPWWYVAFAAQCGVDVVMMAYREALGLPVEPVTSYHVGRRCAYLYYDYHAYRALRQGGHLSFAGWVRSVLGACGPLFRWNDPYPVWDDLRTVLGRQLRHLVAWLATPRDATIVKLPQRQAPPGATSIFSAESNAFGAGERVGV
jgi:predicted ATP-grasp superfamily ATP-dependent carboligase